MADVAVDPWSPTSCRNMDVVGIVERWDKYTYEIMTSMSGTLNSIDEFDLERIQSYNKALRTYASVIFKSNRMDLPHTTPNMYNIQYLTQGLNFDDIKNKALRDIIRLYVNGWNQWSRSESADRSNGYEEFDYNRFLLIMDRIEGFIQSYIDEALPLDLPESSTFEDANNK